MEDWRTGALCGRMDYRIWDASQAVDQSYAVHLCRRHCRVLEQCGADAEEQMRSSHVIDRPTHLVVGGMAFTDDGRPTARAEWRGQCEVCQPVFDTERQAQIERDIAAYAARGQVDA